MCPETQMAVDNGHRNPSRVRMWVGPIFSIRTGRGARWSPENISAVAPTVAQAGIGNVISGVIIRF